MDKKIVLIGDSKRFMVNAILKGLEKDGYDVIIIRPDVTDVSHMENDLTVYVMYLEDDINEELLVFLKDSIDDREIQLFLIGNPEELEEVYHFIPREKIAAGLSRPLNIKELTERLDGVLSTESLRQEQKRILVVDDDGTMLRTIKTWLSSKYRVFMANSGMNAITFLAKNPVDLILLDYEMPVASGPQVLEMIRSEPSTSSIPVMFLTSKSDRESVLKVVSLKPEKYLLKTMPPEELIANIDSFFEKNN
ncbi:MAG: response regulator [Butyrivibrio sp.]|jgi:response regulator RpfG family c-di-GMP phosphodiesterase|nr:response regulator [Butyrivibrio sp.]